MAYQPGFGSVTIAVYNPDFELFKEQLDSIVNQTYKDFEIVLSCDSDIKEIQDFIHENYPHDTRFRIVENTENHGHYQNFENVIKSVSDKSQWIALCDQDDFWFPEKLETLLPHLEDNTLVMGDAFVTDHEYQGTERLHRKVVDTTSLLVQNQVTGCTAIFSTEILPTILPFPHGNSYEHHYHDQWIALVASVTQGYTKVDQPLQYYVQHDNNVVGEPADPYENLSKVQTLKARAKKALSMERLDEYEQLHKWKNLLAEALCERADVDSETTQELDTFLNGDNKSFLGLLTPRAFKKEIPYSTVAKEATAHKKLCLTHNENLVHNKTSGKTKDHE